MPSPRATRLTRHVLVETPEHVLLELELAGLGSRGAAALIDQGIVLLLLLALAVVNLYAVRVGIPGAAVGPGMVIGSFLIWYGYFTFFEGFRRGQTPGKRRMGLRVVMESGHSLSLGSAAIRNLLRTADFLPPPYLLGALFIALHPRNMRLGDMAAGTVVVRDRPREPAATGTPETGRAPVMESPRLTEPEFAFLQSAMLRLPALAGEARPRVLAALHRRFSAHLTDGHDAPGTDVQLHALLEDEAARRSGGLTSPAAELMARQRVRWTEFRPLAMRAQRDGLDSFAAEELLDFAARYRELAADLSRLRTYRASAATVAEVEQLVAAGHNALYRSDGRRPSVLWRAVTEDCPAAVARHWRHVTIAAVTFLAPGLIGYRIIRDRPALAEEVLPATMLERAEAGRAQAASGGKYVSVAIEGRPFTASWIITNNVRVAFFCFAGGVFLGVGALFLLAFNGLQLGATAGHFANVGLAAYLGEFILGHGLLELTAIWIAGGAGLLLGSAFIVPGRYTRSAALTLAARSAVRMLGAAVVCLIVAGLIEGFLSTSAVDIGGRALASALSVAFLLAYIVSGTVRAARRGATPPGAERFRPPNPA